MESAAIIALLKNPVVQGILIKFVLDMIHKGLVAVDNQGLLKPYEKNIHAALLVVTFLASVLDAAQTGNLGTMNLDSLGAVLSNWIPAVLSGKAVSVVTTAPAAIAPASNPPAK